MREMKDSGIEWIGAIPENWEVTRLKYCALLRGRIGWQGLRADEFTDNKSTPYLITGTDFVDGYVNWENCAHISEERYNQDFAIHVRDADLLITKDGTIGKIAIAKDCPTEVSINSGIFILRIINESLFYDRFMYYLLQSKEFELWFELSNIGRSTIKHLTQENFYSFQFAFPQHSEQKKIADYLDTKCTEIDALAVDIESQIETMEQYKRSVITKAVTKGLNPDVKMKNSGIEWVGEIPADWDCIRIVHILDNKHPYAIGDGDHGVIKTEDYIDKGIPFIRVQNLRWCSDLNLDGLVYISEDDNKKIDGSTLRPGDVLFAKTGATIGKTAIVPENMMIANMTSHVAKITVSEKYIPKFILYVLSSQIGYKQLWDIASQKTTRPELSIEEIKTIKLIMPRSKNEQQKIVDYLDSKCTEIDSIIADKRTQLDTLAEYKKSLIYEYVTGKKEVPTA